MERLDPRQLNHHAAAIAVWAYAVAKLPELLPRNEAAPPPPSTEVNHTVVLSLALAGIALFALTTAIFVRVVTTSAPKAHQSGLGHSLLEVEREHEL